MCALLWGTTFAAQSIGADHVGAGTFLACRSWIAIVVLTPVIYAIDRINESYNGVSRRPVTKEDKKFMLIAALFCGSFMFLASAAQQYGIAYTSTAKSSFLTALYVVLVPICSVFLGKRPPAKIWFCVLISLVGMTLLCLGKSFLNGEALTVEKGDVFQIIGALLFTGQVMSVDYFAPKLDGVRLSRAQFVVVAIEATVMALLFESSSTDISDIMSALPAILYAGVLSSGVAYTLQIIGQVGVNPTVATLTMSLEAVIGALSGWVVLGESMLPIEILGGGMMFVSIVLSQIPIGDKKR